MLSKIVFGAVASASAVMLQREPLLSWAPKAPKSHPVDYFVPNFGIDEDVIDTQNSIKSEERRQGVTWNASLKKDQAKPHPTDYFVPDFGIDDDIEDSLSNLKAAESKYGRWDLPKDEDVQLSSSISIEREPLLSWKPKEPKTHPMNYFVPNFGVDHDIASSQTHEKAAEKRLKHKWVPTKDEDDKWKLPSPEIEFRLGPNPRGITNWN